MSFKTRVKAAAAAFRAKSADEPWNISEVQRFLQWLGVDSMAGGPAMSEATYFACLKVLSESLGKLPLKIQQATPGEGIRVAREHPYYRMLNERPNRFMTSSIFWGTIELCRNHFGNGYAWIDTRDPKRPQLWPLNPRSISVIYDNAMVLSDVPDVYYRYSENRTQRIFCSEELLHVKSHNTVDGLVGISVQEQLASTINGNVKSQNMLNKMYENGMTAKSVLQYTGNLSDANVKALVEGIEKYAKGEMSEKAKQIIPIPLGFSLTPLNLKLADSQFMELRQYSALQIAAAFGVKPNQVGDYSKSSYASAEAQQLSFLVDTLLYIVKQYEEEISWKLLSDAEETAGYHTKFNTGVILRADQETQIKTLSSAVSNFLMTPNEARERLDLPSKEGGNKLLGNGASIPVDLTGAQYTKQETAAKTAREEEKAWIVETIRTALSETRV